MEEIAIDGGAVARLLRKADFTAAAVAAQLGITHGAARNKIAGRRAWRRGEIDAVLAAVSMKLARRISFEDVSADGGQRG